MYTLKKDFYIKLYSTSLSLTMLADPYLIWKTGNERGSPSGAVNYENAVSVHGNQIN